MCNDKEPTTAIVYGITRTIYRKLSRYLAYQDSIWLTKTDGIYLRTSPCLTAAGYQRIKRETRPSQVK